MTEPRKARSPRPRGRPRLDIDPDAVADAVAELIAEGGIDAVSIFDAAEKLSVSRATLYRTIPTKQHLVGVLLERSMAEISSSMETALNEVEEPGARLVALVELLTDAAVRMRRYMPLFFGGGDLPEDVFKKWQRWSREFEGTWVRVVQDNIDEGTFVPGDPVVTARLLLGACLWISRWYRPNEPYDVEMITETAVNMVRAMQQPQRKPAKKAPAKSRASKRVAEAS